MAHDFKVGDSVYIAALAKGRVGTPELGSVGTIEVITPDGGEDSYLVRSHRTGYGWWYGKYALCFARAIEERPYEAGINHVTDRSEVQRILEDVQSMKAAITGVEIEVKDADNLIRKGLGVDLESLVKAVPEGVPSQAWKHAILAVCEVVQGSCGPDWAVTKRLVCAALQAAFRTDVVEAPTPQVVCDHGWDD